MSDRPWVPPDEDSEPEDEAWRGDVHLEEWPEHLAGPEYWSGNGEEDIRKRYPPKDEDEEEGA